MDNKLKLVMLGMLAWSVLQIPIAEAIPQCEGIDTANAGQVKNCLSNIPQVTNSMPMFADAGTGCQFAKMYFKTAAGNNPPSIPKCSVLAQVFAQMNGKPTVWADCTDHYEKGGDPSVCLNKLVADMGKNGRAVPTACPNMQKLLLSIAATLLDPIDARNYQAPSCDVIAKALQTNQLQVSATASTSTANANPANANANPTVSNASSTTSGTSRRDAESSSMSPNLTLANRQDINQANLLYEQFSRVAEFRKDCLQRLDDKTKCDCRLHDEIMLFQMSYKSAATMHPDWMGKKITYTLSGYNMNFSFPELTALNDEGKGILDNHNALCR